MRFKEFLAEVEAQVDPRVAYLQKFVDEHQQWADKYLQQAADIEQSNPSQAEAYKKWAASSLEKVKKYQEQIAAVQNTPASFGDNVPNSKERNIILWAAKKFLEQKHRESDEDYSIDLDVKVSQGPRGGVVITSDGEGVVTNANHGKHGWSNWDTEKPPSRIFLFPKNGNLMLYAPETQQKTNLGPIDNAVELIKKLNLLDPEQVTQIKGTGEHEGDTPYQYD